MAQLQSIVNAPCPSKQKSTMVSKYITNLHTDECSAWAVAQEFCHPSKTHYKYPYNLLFFVPIRKNVRIKCEYLDVSSKL